jgi:hypothetical protein
MLLARDKERDEKRAARNAARRAAILERKAAFEAERRTSVRREVREDLIGTRVDLRLRAAHDLARP